MLSGHVEGQALKFLVHLAGARRVLEIGMFTGYSALAMAEALPDDGVVVACEIDAGRRPIRAASVSTLHRRVDRSRSRSGPATDDAARARRRSVSANFDFVFIDADKPGYLRLRWSSSWTARCWHHGA